MPDAAIPAQPVIIIGAGRSGTNMLRDVLTRLEGFDTWPCDEINYIWRFGNRDHPTDELEPSMVTSSVRSYIRNRFKEFAAGINSSNKNDSQHFIVEKTCANSLRVEYVDSIIPEAKYLFLIRDGRDVVASAGKRWQAPIDIPYLLAKARYVPFLDLGYYASRYLINRVKKLVSKQRKLAVWGPKFDRMQGLSESHDLDYVCAAQWLRCVELAETAFESLPEEKWMLLRYEDFVANPVDHLEKISNFLGIVPERLKLTAACEDVRTGFNGQERKSKCASDSDWHALIRPMLVKYRYQ